MSGPQKRIRRPFRHAPRKPTRRELFDLLRRIHGPDIPYYMGSPYAGTRLDDVELILHELGHATQIDGEFPVELGNMGPSWERMHAYLKALGKRVGDDVADGHEIRTIAIVLGLARTLRLPFSRDLLTNAGARNSFTKELHMDPKKFAREVESVEHSAAVRAGIQDVLDLLDRAWCSYAAGEEGQ